MDLVLNSVSHVYITQSFAMLMFFSNETCPVRDHSFYYYSEYPVFLMTLCFT